MTLTVDEVAKILGIGRNSAYEAINRGDVPSLRLGRRLVVPRKALEALLEGRQQDRPASATDAPIPLRSRRIPR